MERGKEKGPGAAATAHRAKSVAIRKSTVPNTANGPDCTSLFEVDYRDRRWRFSLSAYGGQPRLSIWAHYRDRNTGGWKPCGSKCRCGTIHESAGLMIPLERVGELIEGLGALQLQIVPDGLSEAA